MSHTQHTPGPWEVYDGPSGYQHRIISDDAVATEVCDVRKSCDARLIASAPAMLAALRVMVGVTINSGRVSDDMAPALEMALAAIKQATGGAP